MNYARSARRFSTDAITKHPPDIRTPGQRDRDRVLYSDYFRRLAGVTQVVGARETGHFHNRLTHTLEVAQIARRIAERLVGEDPAIANVDPDVVETAALAHDIGHPPFGHIAEAQLDELVSPATADGFEGNAQSFRIVTKLARRTPDHLGLDMTRASLQAVSKYPWPRATAGAQKRKYGAYAIDRADFDWSREGLPDPFVRTAEAEIMDWADDVAYALHDLQDFFRAGLVPLDRIATTDSNEYERFLVRTFERWDREGKQYDSELYEAVGDLLRVELPLDSESAAESQLQIHRFVAFRINSYVRALSVTGDGVTITPEQRAEVDLLKAMTWNYVIDQAALSAQQEGQRRVVRELFGYYHEACVSNKVQILPSWAQAYMQNDDLKAVHEDERDLNARLACDVVASLSEGQALALHARITGVEAGSVRDSINP